MIKWSAHCTDLQAWGEASEGLWEERDQANIIRVTLGEEKNPLETFSAS